jgi:hypothetical protein
VKRKSPQVVHLERLRGGDLTAPKIYLETTMFNFYYAPDAPGYRALKGRVRSAVLGLVFYHALLSYPQIPIRNSLYYKGYKR